MCNNDTRIFSSPRTLFWEYFPLMSLCEIYKNTMDEEKYSYVRGEGVTKKTERHFHLACTGEGKSVIRDCGKGVGRTFWRVSRWLKNNRTTAAGMEINRLIGFRRPFNSLSQDYRPLPAHRPSALRIHRPRPYEYDTGLRILGRGEGGGTDEISGISGRFLTSVRETVVNHKIKKKSNEIKYLTNENGN